jgi:hypothetical protein
MEVANCDAQSVCQIGASPQALRFTELGRKLKFANCVATVPCERNNDSRPFISPLYFARPFVSPDYTVWRKTLGQTVDADSGADSGADGAGPLGAPDGIVDRFDYELRKSHYGNSNVKGASSLAFVAEAICAKMCFLAATHQFIGYEESEEGGRSKARSNLRRLLR